MEDQLASVRALYSLGNYPAVSGGLVSNSVNPDDFELITLIWKSILRATPEGDVSKCAQFWVQCACHSELLKKSLMLWSKVGKGTNFGMGNLSSVSKAMSADLMAAQEIASKAHESNDMDPQERDQVILTCAEIGLLLNSSETCFNLLKLAKASNLDVHVMFIEILLKLNQIKMAQDRLEKLKNIPEWRNDVRFLLIEAQVNLQSSQNDHDGDDDDDASMTFNPTNSLYSLQELIQIYGQTPRLSVLLAGAYVLLGKFQEAHNTLQDSRDDPIINSNQIIISALLNTPNFSSSLKEFESKFPKFNLFPSLN